MVLSDGNQTLCYRSESCEKLENTCEELEYTHIYIYEYKYICIYQAPHADLGKPGQAGLSHAPFRFLAGVFPWGSFAKSLDESEVRQQAALLLAERH